MIIIQSPWTIDRVCIIKKQTSEVQESPSN